MHTDVVKTAHGLIRGTNRFKLLAVIDEKHTGNDAGIVLDGNNRGIPIVSSIDEVDIVKLATKHKVELIDIRKPKSIRKLHFWTGEFFNVDVPIIAVLGMDCHIGKGQLSD